ncbi:hypothetical protein [Tumebacillus permanentifrigoris]|uniref:D-alanyl-D-alanine carboxypeptidase n=1 Tax=Tumebacillus permanentifrigoris TaxID=378543 RepID=A0A316D949_9BACL|nr:hypothetical protein [Tumebacillus permanentifrigoris]PWK13499.1 hypothetical protein C7459_107168 [Tumebacillus permanentifrigoris]
MALKKNWIRTMTATLLALSATGLVFNTPLPATATTTSGLTSTVLDPALLAKATTMLDTDSQKIILTYTS